MFFIPPAHCIYPSPAIPSLRDIIASCVLDLSAQRSESYGGSGQTWANLVTGEGALDDFWMGADSAVATDDPAFAGSAGTATGEFIFDAGDIFTQKSGGDIVSQIHKSTNTVPWSVSFHIRNQSGDEAFATTRPGGGAGVLFFNATSGRVFRFRAYQPNDTFTNIFQSTAQMPVNQDSVFTFSFNPSGRACRFKKHGETVEESTGSSWTNTAEAATPFVIDGPKAGYKLYNIAFFTSALSEAEMDLVHAEMLQRRTL